MVIHLNKITENGCHTNDNWKGQIKTAGLKVQVKQVSKWEIEAWKMM